MVDALDAPQVGHEPIPPPSMVGSHVATSRGLVKGGISEAVHIGAEVIQVFTGNPRSWRAPASDAAGDDRFRAACDQMRLRVFVHAAHLINLGSPSAETLIKSTALLRHTMERASAIGAEAVVVHAGSAVLAGRRSAALDKLHELLTPVLDASPARVRLLIEPTAGGGEALASTIQSTINYLAAVDDVRLGVCLDTCHLHAAGHDISSTDQLTDRLEYLESAIGPGRLALIHVNDSRDPVGSRRDRHESLGKGTIGADGFGALFSIPALHGVPFIVETPTHAADVALLQRARELAQARPH
jgi:deoxyribonuclease-4